MTTPNTLGELIQFASTDPVALPNPFRMWDIVAGGGFLSPAEGLAYFGIPGVDRLEAVAQAEWGEPLTVANLLRIRGRLVRDRGITPTDADAMPLILVATRVSGALVTPPTADTSPTYPAPFDQLAALAQRLRMKGDELEAVLWLCRDGGTVSIEQMASRFEWSMDRDVRGRPYAENSWYKLARRVNKKITEKHGWFLCTRGSNPTVERTMDAV